MHTPGPVVRHRRRYSRPAEITAACTLVAAGITVGSPISAAQGFHYADLPMLWTVAHGPACAGWISGNTVVAESMPGTTRLVVQGSFFGLSWRPPEPCSTTVTVRWHNVDTGERGTWRSRTTGAIGMAPVEIGEVMLDTGPGRVVMNLGTDLAHLPVAHDVVAW